MSSLEQCEDRVLVLAPTGRDALLICDALQKGGLPCDACADLEGLASELEKGAGAALCAEEALIGTSAKKVINFLKDQPAWSDFPLVFISRSGIEAEHSSARLLSVFGEQANISIVERPIRVSTLVSSVRSALRARRRQYEVRDYIAERKRREEQLLQVGKLESLGVLAGGVAHDFNNLLTGILGNASLAQDNLAQNMPVDDLLADIVDASQRAADLTRQLLAYSGKGKFVIRPIDISALVGQISRLVQTSVPRSVTLELDLAEHLPAVEGDSSQLQQIVMNLVINGAEAIGPDAPGTVRIRSGVEQGQDGHSGYLPGADQLQPGAYVFLEVEDTGIGMDEATISRIFDPFFTTKFLGRGLGLAAVSGIVRGHKGALKVHSVPGKGTTFRVLFPAARVREKVEPVNTRKDLSGKGVILVVEDEEVVQKIARNALERYGYEVLLAENGEEGVHLFQNRADHVSLVLLDMTMPVMSGEEAFRHFKTRRPDVKVVLTSGYNETEVFRHFNEKGLAGFIQKPYTAAELAEKIQTVLHR